MNATDVWTETQKELELQMSKATFDTWIRGTRGRTLADGVLTVAVPNGHYRDWLESRLKETVGRTLAGILGQPAEVRYQIGLNDVLSRPSVEPNETAATPAEPAEPVEPSEMEVTLIDKPTNDFIILPRYDLFFWQPLLGPASFSSFLLLRAAAREYRVKWGKSKRVRVDLLAASQGVHRQTLTGRKREGEWLKGTFDHLNDFGVARIRIVGEGRDVVYQARVLHELPLLAPAQLARLGEELQTFHASYLKEFDIDYARWEQLAMPSLVPAEEVAVTSR